MTYPLAIQIRSAAGSASNKQAMGVELRKIDGDDIHKGLLSMVK